MGIDKGGACFCFWKFQGSDKKEVEFPSRGDQEKILRNFRGSWFVKGKPL